MVDISKYVSFDAEKECNINEMVLFDVLVEILDACGDDEETLKMSLEEDVQTLFLIPLLLTIFCNY